MAIRLKLEDGSVVEADSVEELVNYQQALRRSRNGTGRSEVKTEQQEVLPLPLEELPERARKLVELLLPSPEGLESAELAARLGITPRGTGGYVTALASWGKRAGMTKRQMVVRGRRRMPSGGTAPTIGLSKFFRKIIQEGRIPGMKLDA